MHIIHDTHIHMIHFLYVSQVYYFAHNTEKCIFANNSTEEVDLRKAVLG